ncbi:glycosyltransferase family 2 protein [Magnetospirillum sulfuroxidans]|uniref:Glycosyltransferase family 2 protein n=1 Tax=Magnetospirillum sulfuroxidans TaxID=611300 RepID=A0ABS5IF09_9PROT|nr:glycosyltransferase family 2 protein [Magnetospirillum sulfuroxidans]MBR9972777.1 glycosyltransferase family 2 protein [Magnetospirillum sulfuroxidans]
MKAMDAKHPQADEPEQHSTACKPFQLFVVVPAYNEESSIAAVISGLRSIADTIGGLGGSLHILLVNDGSKDRTVAEAEKAGVDGLVSHRINQGLGAAVRTGINEAIARGADIVVKFDADLQHDPTDIPALISPILEDRADLVYGHRHNRIAYRMPLIRRLGNKFFNALMGFLTKQEVTDGQPGIIALGAAYLSKFHIPGNYNYSQQILLDAYFNGMRFTQVDVSFRPRTTGQSFISLRYPIIAISQILIILAMFAPMRIFGRFGLICTLIGGVLFIIQIAMYFLGITDKPVTNVNLVFGLVMLGMQSLSFGIIAELIRQQKRP